MRDCRCARRVNAWGPLSASVFDYESTNFHLRWALPHVAEQWKASGPYSVSEEALQQWLETAKDQCGPPLTATRTLGALGGIVASRIAREFQFGGPSFVVSAEEASGLQAVEIGMRNAAVRGTGRRAGGCRGPQLR